MQIETDKSPNQFVAKLDNPIPDKLDYSKFRQTILMAVVGLSCDKQMKSVIHNLDPYLPKMLRKAKFKKTYFDSQGLCRKLFLIRPFISTNCLYDDQVSHVCVDKIEECLIHLKSLNVDLPKNNFLDPQLVIDLTQDRQELDETIDIPCFAHVMIDYKNFTFEQAISVALPSSVLSASAFTITGHVVQFNLRPEHHSYRYIIGSLRSFVLQRVKDVQLFIKQNVLLLFSTQQLHQHDTYKGKIALDKIVNARTVVNKSSVIENEYRTSELELLAGEPNYITVVRENNVNFHLDISKVYWNSRLSTEHTRILDKLRPTIVTENDTDASMQLMSGQQVMVYDVFAGIGPFSIPAGRLHCNVFANDLNPSSYEWLVFNLKAASSKKYRLADNVTCFNLDGRQFIREVVLPHYWKHQSSPASCQLDLKHFVVLMNLPALALDFLDAFVNSADCDAVECIRPLQVYCYCFLKQNLESVDTVKDRIVRAFQCTDWNELLCLDGTTSSSNVRIDNFNMRLVRNVSPSKDMHCVEFQLFYRCRPSSTLPAKRVKLDDDGRI